MTPSLNAPSHTHTPPTRTHAHTHTHTHTHTPTSPLPPTPHPRSTPKRAWVAPPPSACGRTRTSARSPRPGVGKIPLLLLTCTNPTRNLALNPPHALALTHSLLAANAGRLAVSEALTWTSTSLGRKVWCRFKIRVRIRIWVSVCVCICMYMCVYAHQPTTHQPTHQPTHPARMQRTRD